MAALITLVVAGLAAAPLVEPVPPDAAVDIVERLNEPVPLGLSFHDSTGQKVALRDLLHGPPVILAMVYYRCPVLCGLLLSGLAKTLTTLDWQLGREYDVITVSLDPSDTPKEAAASRRGYLQALNQPTSKAWAFLTGRVDDIDTLSDAIGMRYQYLAGQRQFAHVAALFVLTPEGHLSRYLYGVSFDPRQVKLALFEAAQGRVGTSFERVLLRCYRYDPKSKRYELFVTRYFRVSGVVLLILVGGLLVSLWRRELSRVGQTT